MTIAFNYNRYLQLELLTHNSIIIIFYNGYYSQLQIKYNHFFKYNYYLKFQLLIHNLIRMIAYNNYYLELQLLLITIIVYNCNHCS